MLKKALHLYHRGRGFKSYFNPDYWGLRFISIIIARIILNGWFSQCELNSDFLTLLRIAIKWDFPFFSRFLPFLLEFLSSHFSLFHYYYFLNVLVLGQLRSEKFGSIGQSKETLQWIGTKEALSRVRRGKLSTNSSANSSEIRKSTQRNVFRIC